MLRITDVRETTGNGHDLWTLRLDGGVQGHWIKELERAWQAVKRTAPATSIRLMLGDVRAVDVAGRALLSDMHRAGVEIVASDAFTASVREDIVAS